MRVCEAKNQKAYKVCIEHTGDDRICDIILHSLDQKCQ